jgi:hypothetical protein
LRNHTYPENKTFGKPKKTTHVQEMCGFSNKRNIKDHFSCPWQHRISVVSTENDVFTLKEDKSVVK